MANLGLTDGIELARFRYGGREYKKSLKTRDRREAADGLRAVESAIHQLTTGVFRSLFWILLSRDAFEEVYGLRPADAVPLFTQPGIVTIPPGFAAVVLVSLLTKRRTVAAAV